MMNPFDNPPGWYFNPYAILPFATSIIVLYFGLTILFKNRKNPLNRSFCYWCLAVFGWLFFYSLGYSLKNSDLAVIFARIGCCIVMLNYVTAAHFMFNFLEAKKWDFYVRLGYFVFALIIWPNTLFTTNLLEWELYNYFFGYYNHAGKYYLFLVLFCHLYALPPYLILYQSIQNRKLPEKKLQQAKQILIGFVIAIFAGVDYLPKFGIEIYPLGCLLILCWALIIFYSIFKNELLELNILVKKGLIYSCLASMISFIYLLCALLFQKMFEGFLGYQSVIGIILTAILIVSIFNPLKDRIQEFVERFIFKGTGPELAFQNELLIREISQSEKSKAVAQLASGIAHEIKNPLTTIKTFFEFLPERKNDPEFMSKLSKIVGNEINRVDELTRQLLDFAKPSALELQDTDILKLLNDSLSLLESQLKHRKIQLIKHFTIHDSRSTVKADSNKLKQALLNILLNAIDAMPNGGTLTVSASLSDPDPRSTNHVIKIEIQDTGCGIDKKDLPRIFDPFFSKKEKGTGLGLAITKGIIEEHGGGIKAESFIGIGTKFIINIKTSYLDNG